MRISVSVGIDAPRRVVWSLVTDIENAAASLSGVESVEVLERPERGLIGLKWRETRKFLGTSATETMWVTAAEEGAWYATEARSHGSIFQTVLRLDEAAGGTRLEMEFSARATTFAARMLSLLFGPFVGRSVRRALVRDLQDLRAAAEARSAAERTG
jgi:uncharacterized membrane protein